MVFFCNDTATTEIYTLSLHDALPIVNREARVAPPDRFADGARRDDRSEDRGPLPYAQLGDPLYVRQVLVARWVVRDHVGQRGDAEVAERGLDARSDAREFGHGPRTKVRQGRPRGDR